jgi:hypothetical protein
MGGKGFHRARFRCRSSCNHVSLYARVVFYVCVPVYNYFSCPFCFP